MIRILLLAGLLFATALPAQAQISAMGHVSLVDQPSREDVRRVYPLTALQRNLEGAAVIQCIVQSNRRLQSCQVVSEDPAGYGFGQAAVSLGPRFRVSPRSRVNTVVVVRIDFLLDWVSGRSEH